MRRRGDLDRRVANWLTCLALAGLTTAPAAAAETDFYSGKTIQVVIGFSAGRDYEFVHFLDDAADAGFAPELLLSTWDLRPFTDDSDFLIALLRPD